MASPTHAANAAAYAADATARVQVKQQCCTIIRTYFPTLPERSHK